jgi:Na+/proline symporter
MLSVKAEYVFHDVVLIATILFVSVDLSSLIIPAIHRDQCPNAPEGIALTQCHWLIAGGIAALAISSFFVGNVILERKMQTVSRSRHVARFNVITLALCVLWYLIWGSIGFVLLTDPANSDPIDQNTAVGAMCVASSFVSLVRGLVLMFGFRFTRL